MEYQKVTASQGLAWYKDGWVIFTRIPGILMAQFVVLAVLTLAIHMVPLAGDIVVAVMNPILVAGMYRTAAATAEGGKAGFMQLFSGFQDRFNPLLVLGAFNVAAQLVMGAAFFLLAGRSAAMEMLLERTQEGGTGQMAREQMGAAALSTSGMVGGGAGLAILAVLALLIVMAFYFAVPLVALKGEAPLDSLKGSFLAIVRNWKAFVVFGLLLVVFGVIAIIPLGLGLLVLVPIVIGANYSAYREIFLGEKETPPGFVA